MVRGVERVEEKQSGGAGSGLMQNSKIMRKEGTEMSDIQKQICENGPNGFQREAIMKFWNRAKPKGWKFTRKSSVLWDGTIEMVFTDGSHRHWIRFSPIGECVPAPTTMVTRI